MTELLRARREIIKFYKRYETVILFCVKMFFGILILRLVNGAGLYHERFSPLFEPPFDFPYIALSALLFAASPPTLGLTIVALHAVVQISASLEVAVYAAGILICVIVFYARLAPRMNMLIIAALFGFYLRIPYAVVIFAGLYWGLNAIMPVVIATVIYQFAPMFMDLSRMFRSPERIDITVLPETFTDVYRMLFNSFTAMENFAWIYMGFAFGMAILAVYIISRLPIHRSKDIAVGAGGAACLIFTLIGIALGVVGIGVFEVFLTVLISVSLVEGIRFFESALDHKKAENVQFEDEDNFYYVRIVPKVVYSKRMTTGGEKDKRAE
jgi:hypothetical protein